MGLPGTDRQPQYTKDGEFNLKVIQSYLNDLNEMNKKK